MSFSHYYICGFISLHVWTGWVVAAIWWEFQVNGTLRNIFSLKIELKLSSILPVEPGLVHLWIHLSLDKLASRLQK